MNEKTRELRKNLRTMVRGAYALQQLRIQMGNRLVAQFASKLGVKPSEKVEENEDASEVWGKLKASFKKLTDGLKHGLPSKDKFVGDGVISDYTELVLVRNYMEIENREIDQFKRLEDFLKEFPIYTEFLSKIRGIGNAMAGVLISEIDIEKANSAASLFKLSGLDVDYLRDAEGNPIAAKEGEEPMPMGRSTRKGHQVIRKYTNKHGEEAERWSLTYSPFLKSKLMGVLATCFLRQNAHYKKMYDDYKFRLEQHPEHKKKTKAHRHMMSMRRMVKIFLQEFWMAWRKIEDLPIKLPYHEAKLGMEHHKNVLGE